MVRPTGPVVVPSGPWLQTADGAGQGPENGTGPGGQGLHEPGRVMTDPWPCLRLRPDNPNPLSGGVVILVISRYCSPVTFDIVPLVLARISIAGCLDRTSVHKKSDMKRKS